jgi:hypothetical protein
MVEEPREGARLLGGQLVAHNDVIAVPKLEVAHEARQAELGL